MRLFNQTPYASSLNRNDEDDKRRMERFVLHEWLASFSEGDCIGAIYRGDDPPDFVFESNGETRSVEITELVDGKLKSEVKYLRSKGVEAHGGHPEIFPKAQWNEERFKSELEELVYKKENQYARRQIKPIDYLLIISAEPWLSSVDVAAWIGKLDLSRVSRFQHVHLMLDYDPSRKQWPVFRIT